MYRDPGDQRPDVFVINAKDRIVCVTASQCDIMVRLKTGRKATPREVEAYQKRLTAQGVRGASPHGIVAEVAEKRATAEVAKVEDEVGDPDAPSSDEARVALKSYDTKAKMLALAAAHELEGLSDKMTVADLKDALIQSVRQGAIPFESL